MAREKQKRKLRKVKYQQKILVQEKELFIDNSLSDRNVNMKKNLFFKQKEKQPWFTQRECMLLKLRRRKCMLMSIQKKGTVTSVR